jgi:hypothetical protein
MIHETREAWLEEAVGRLGELFHDINIEIPPVRVSIGWPSKGGLSTRNRTVGQCWKASVSTDGVPQIFISPTLDQVDVILGTLVHELIHAWDDCESGHKGKFAAAARKVGLEGKLTATHVSEGSDLYHRLQGVSEGLGKFPHAALVMEELTEQRPKQTTRMIKLVTPECCEYTVRTTAKWINEGLPLCPHGVEMEQETT